MDKSRTNDTTGNRLFGFRGNRDFDAVLISHKGRLRRRNEDNYLFAGSINPDSSSEPIHMQATLKPGALVGVFDGMGGEALGEVASLLAAQSLSEDSSGVLEGNRHDILAARLKAANGRVCEYENENGIACMGCTAVLLILDREMASVANLGDSRAYLFRRGTLHQLTVDHTQRQAILDAGLFLPELCMVRKGALTQYLGAREEYLTLQPAIRRIRIRAGDLILLCSDGLTDMVEDDRIQEILHAHPFEEAAGMLLDTALESGGRDNVTILLARA